MRIWPLVLALLFSAGAALAQTAVVRSGEHAAFTRLVIALPERLPYTLTRSGDSADLAFARPGVALDISAVFERVPKTRLADLEVLPGGGGLRLTLGCACEIEAFWFARSSLVLDIAARPGGAATPPLPDRAARLDRLRPLPVPPPRSRLASRLASRALGPESWAETDTQTPTSAAGEGTPRLREDAIGASRQTLIREIGRAATQGLLSPRLDRAPPPSPSTAQPAPPPATPQPRPPPTGIQMLARTSIDRDLAAALGEGQKAHSPACLDPARVDVAAWGTDAPFWRQVGPLRARLLGEFDTPDGRAVRQLARLYVFFGFGAEARQLLSELGGPATADPVLDAMAAILEEGHAESGSALSHQTACAPTVALWSALSYRDIPTGIALDGDTLLRGLSSLPAHLRAHLGPALARRLHAAGYARESARVRRLLSRSPKTVTPEGRLLDAEIALAGENPPAGAEAALETLIPENTGPSAVALLRLIDARLERGAGISHETAQLAGAYATEYRGQPLGASLAEAYLSALAASGDFGQAFAELPRVLGPGTPGNTEIRARLSGMLARDASDYDFLYYVIAGSASPPEGLDPAIGDALARRLLSLGFTAEAAAYLAPGATGAAADARRRLRARLALATDRPRQAEAELIGLDGEEAMSLRARARSMAGEHDVAQTLYLGAGDAAAARREGWLAGDREHPSGTDGTAQSALAKLTQAGAARETAAPQGMLARSDALVAQSRDTRAAIEALLSAYPAPPR